MTDMERELRQALRRREAPEGFVEAVLSRTGRQSVPPARRRWWAWAALLLLALGLSVAGREYQRARRAEELKQQLSLALQITAQELNLVSLKLRGRQDGRTALPAGEPPLRGDMR